MVGDFESNWMETIGITELLSRILPKGLSKPMKNLSQDNRSPYEKSNQARSVTPNCSVMYIHVQVNFSFRSHAYVLRLHSCNIKKLDFSSEKGNLSSAYIVVWATDA
jgi:hypothetical protein